MSLYGFAYAKPERVAEFRALLLSLVEPTRAEAGCLEYNVHEEEGGVFYLYEVWRSEQDLEKHIARDYMRGFWAHRMEYLRRDLEAHRGIRLSSFARGNGAVR